MKALGRIDHYLLDAVIRKWLRKKPCKFDKKKIPASNFFMHIFYMSVTYLHSVENIQGKL